MVVFNRLCESRQHVFSTGCGVGVSPVISRVRCRIPGVQGVVVLVGVYRVSVSKYDYWSLVVAATVGVAVAIISWTEIGCLAFMSGRRLFLDEFPFLIFFGGDFAEFQKVPERVIGVKMGIGFGGGGSGSGGSGDGFRGKESFGVQEVFDTEFAAIVYHTLRGNRLFTATVTGIATDAENIKAAFVIRISHL